MLVYISYTTCTVCTTTCIQIFVLWITLFQSEASLGYAHWVCSTLQEKVHQDEGLYKYSIEQMAAIPVAADALAKYLGKKAQLLKDCLKINFIRIVLWHTLIQWNLWFKTTPRVTISGLT